MHYAIIVMVARCNEHGETRKHDAFCTHVWHVWSAVSRSNVQLMASSTVW